MTEVHTPDQDQDIGPRALNCTSVVCLMFPYGVARVSDISFAVGLVQGFSFPLSFVVAISGGQNAFSATVSAVLRRSSMWQPCVVVGWGAAELQDDPLRAIACKRCAEQGQRWEADLMQLLGHAGFVAISAPFQMPTLIGRHKQHGEEDLSALSFQVCVFV